MSDLGTEKVLRPVVEGWLQTRGYYVAHEIMICGYCDLVGCRWHKRIGRRIPIMSKIVTVELKIRDISGVLYQAKNNCYYVDYSYAAMPMSKCKSMRYATLYKFKEEGIGLLGINHCVNIVIPARRNKIIHNSNICRRLWNFKIRHRFDNE